MSTRKNETRIGSSSEQFTRNLHCYRDRIPRQHAVAPGHDGSPVEDALSDEQVLRRAGSSSHGPGTEDDQRSVQGGAGGVEGGGGAGATVHLLFDRVQRPVRGPRGDLSGRIRGGPLPEPDGSVQLRRRRHPAGLRRAQAQRRPEEVHVALGRVHHRLRLPVRAKDPLEISNVGGAGMRQVRLQRFREDDSGHDRGKAADQGEIRGPDHAGVQMFGCLAEIGRPLADSSHTLAAP